MLIGKKNRVADAFDTVLSDYPVLNLKKKNKALHYRSVGHGISAKGYLHQTFSGGQYQMDIPMEICWKPNCVTLILNLCPRAFADTMSLPRAMFSAGARTAYNLKARNTQIMSGSRENGYNGHGFVLEGVLPSDVRQAGHALRELLTEVTVRRREELSDFCILTLG